MTAESLRNTFEFSRNTQRRQVGIVVLLKYENKLDTVISHISLNSMCQVKFKLV